MPSQKEIVKEIHDLTGCLIGTALLDRFNYPKVYDTGNAFEITVGEQTGGTGYGGIPYIDIYTQIRQKNFYNFLLLDGSLITLQYFFSNENLSKHRLCFWSSPTYESFQNEPEIYQEDDLYIEYLEPSLVPFPFRFDFDSSDTATKPIFHPKSHLTFGAFKNCRIPVCSPVGPSTFVKFILRNFYNTGFLRFEDKINCRESAFGKTIDHAESVIPHLSLRV
jgi:hypothetical protein